MEGETPGLFGVSACYSESTEVFTELLSSLVLWNPLSSKRIRPPLTLGLQRHHLRIVTQQQSDLMVPPVFWFGLQSLPLVECLTSTTQSFIVSNSVRSQSKRNTCLD